LFIFIHPTVVKSPAAVQAGVELFARVGAAAYILILALGIEPPNNQDNGAVIITFSQVFTRRLFHLVSLQYQLLAPA
jgi:hypothetical protein